MIKRLIFDVDDTLITGVNFVSEIEATLKRLGVYSKENLKLFLEANSSYESVFNNFNKTDYTNHIGKALGVKLDDNFLSILFEEVKTCVPIDNTKLKESLIELSQKYELVLLTNFFKESQLNRLNTMGIKDLFLECYGEELIKPNDEIYLRACGKFNPTECVMIGDDPYLDIEKAQGLGINAIFVNSKGLKVENLNTLVVNRVEEISVDLIESLEGMLENTEDLNTGVESF